MRGSQAGALCSVLWSPGGALSRGLMAGRRHAGVEGHCSPEAVGLATAGRIWVNVENCVSTFCRALYEGHP